MSEGVHPKAVAGYGAEDVIIEIIVLHNYNFTYCSTRL
jgi:hypothetical protein